MTQTPEKVIRLGTPYQCLQEVIDLSENYFFIGITEDSKIAYSVSLNEPKWRDVAILNICVDYIKQILVDQYEWIPDMEEDV